MPLSEKAKQNKTRYNINYSKSHYKRVPLDLSPEQYQATKDTADSLGESVNGFIKKSISERIDRVRNSADDPHHGEKK